MKIVSNILNYLIKNPAVGRISTLDIISTNIYPRLDSLTGLRDNF